MKRIEVSSKNFKGICNSLGYRRMKVKLCVTNEVTLHGLNWDSGSKNTYHACDLSTGLIRTGAHLGNPHPWFNKNEGEKVSIPPNMAVIKTGYFLGKESMMEIYVRPENMPKLLEDQ